MKNTSRNFGFFQTIRNLVANGLFFLFDVIISMWYTPFLIGLLGRELYGLIPLAMSVKNYFSILTFSEKTSSDRFITVELEKGNKETANRIFNTNHVITLVIIAIAFPLIIMMVAFVPNLFVIPEGMEWAGQLLFLAILGTYLLETYKINFEIAAFARNRFDLRNIISFGARIIQVGIVLSLFYLDNPNIIWVGVGAAGASLFNLMGDFYLWRRLLPEISIHLRDFRKQHLKSLFGAGTWTLLYQIGFTLFLNVDMLIANRMLSLTMAGMYGALLSIPKNLRILSLAIGGIWGPSLMSRFSHSDNRGMEKLMDISIKLSGFVLALIVGLVCGMGGPFLEWWLGADFAALSGLLVLMSFPLAVNLIVQPFFNVLVTINKMKVPAISTIILGVLNLVLALVLVPYLELKGIVMAGVITMTLNYSVIIPIYVAKVTNLPWWHYSSRLAMILAATALVGSGTYLISLVVELSSFTRLVIVGGSISGIYLLLVYFLGLNSGERELVRGLLNRKSNTQ
ncbi:MAG: lipopolysaccharide biosynthesis protein [Anaerolineaceae bacterium]|nr:lipopolysaccharide biosynthesis protein [Anaerolineaceae bacterium]